MLSTNYITNDNLNLTGNSNISSIKLLIITLLMSIIKHHHGTGYLGKSYPLKQK